MASKSFTLADGPDIGGKAPCSKCCIYSCVLVFIVLLAAAGVYFYSFAYACSYPELDETGLSNYTSGAERIAYACFPGFYLEGESDLMVAECDNGLWNPAPPSCNSLPLRIDCQVNNQSLVGNITMWQEKVDGPTYIHGLINYKEAVKPQGHVMEHVVISKKTCNISHIIPEDFFNSQPYPEPKPKLATSSSHPSTTSSFTSSSSTSSTTPTIDHTSGESTETDTDEALEESTSSETPEEGKYLQIKFNSTLLKGYKKTDLFMNIIFVDSKTTATLVSVHQANLTLVMTDPVHSPNSSWNMDKEKKVLLKYGFGSDYRI